MTVNFPLFPDGASLYEDNRQVMSNHQIYTRSPERQSEVSLAQFSDNIYGETRMDIRRSLESGRRAYSSIKRSLGSSPTEVNTSERVATYKRSAIEESKERARRATTTAPRRPKEYVYPTEREKKTLHSKKVEKPLINEERMAEYKRRTAAQLSTKVTYEPLSAENTSTPKDPFDREQKDYFRKKRDRLFDRGV